MAVAANLSAEERRLLAQMREDDAQAGDLPPASPALQAQIDSEAEASGALMLDSTVHDRVMGMADDEFEGEFADVLNANAHDDDEPVPGAGPAGE